MGEKRDETPMFPNPIVPIFPEAATFPLVLFTKPSNQVSGSGLCLVILGGGGGKLAPRDFA